MASGKSFLETIEDIYREVEFYRQNLSPQISIFKDNGRNLMPQRIGFGLFHHNVFDQIVQRSKIKALTDVVSDIGSVTEDQLIGMVQVLLPRIEACYEERSATYASTAPRQQAEIFAKDACFILKFFSARFDERIYDITRRTEVVSDIFMPSNQIPLFLLVEIMKMHTRPNEVAAQFVQGLARYPPFKTLSPVACGRDIIQFLNVGNVLEFLVESDHLLHLLHKSIAHFLEVPDNHTTAGLTTPVECHYVLRNLEKYSITFKARNGGVLFTKRTLRWSILHLPKIRLEEDTIPFHKSLMAFDWKSRKYCQLISDLTFLMHCIVEDSNKNLFSKARIIQGDSERFCQRLDDLFRDLTNYYGSPGYHGGVYRKEIINELDEYSKNVWNEWMYKAWGLTGLILSLVFAALAFVVGALALKFH